MSVFSSELGVEIRGGLVLPSASQCSASQCCSVDCCQDAAQELRAGARHPRLGPGHAPQPEGGGGGGVAAGRVHGGLDDCVLHYEIKIEALGASPSQPSPLTEDLN